MSGSYFTRLSSAMGYARLNAGGYLLALIPVRGSVWQESVPWFRRLPVQIPGLG